MPTTSKEEDIASYKQGFLEATVEYVLRRENLRKNFLNYLMKLVEKETRSVIVGEGDVGRWS